MAPCDLAFALGSGYIIMIIYYMCADLSYYMKEKVREGATEREGVEGGREAGRQEGREAGRQGAVGSSAQNHMAMIKYPVGILN